MSENVPEELKILDADLQELKTEYKNMHFIFSQALQNMDNLLRQIRSENIKMQRELQAFFDAAKNKEVG